MKNCPKCGGFALYSDELQECPLCGGGLVPYVRPEHKNGGDFSGPVNPEEWVEPEAEGETDDAVDNGPPVFATRKGGRYVYRGRITEINNRSRLHSGFKKWVNSLFRGEPFQFSHTSHLTVLRVEEFVEGCLPSHSRDLIFYGDVEGRFVHGDDVTVTAKRMSGDRYAVVRLYLNDIETYVRPEPQLPAWIIQLVSLLGVILAVSLVNTIISFFASGAAMLMVTQLLSWLIKFGLKFVLPILIMWWVIRALFGR